MIDCLVSFFPFYFLVWVLACGMVFGVLKLFGRILRSWETEAGKI